MKAMVVDVEGEYAVVLTKDGGFARVRNNRQYQVGHEIEVPSKSGMNLKGASKLVATAAAVLLFMSVGVGVYAYNSPYYYINVDINPSVEITTNVFDRIIGVKALNADGEKVIAHSTYKNHKLEEGIKDILKGAVEEGYLKTDAGEAEESMKVADNAVMFTISGKNADKATKIKKDIQEAAKTNLKSSKVKSQIVVENVSMDSHSKATDMGVSAGKLLLLDKLKEAKPQAREEEYKNAPVKDIIDIIRTEREKKWGEADGSESKDKVKKGLQGKDSLEGLIAASERQKHGWRQEESRPQASREEEKKISGGNAKNNAGNANKAPAAKDGKKNDLLDNLTKGKGQDGKKQVDKDNRNRQNNGFKSGHDIKNQRDKNSKDNGKSKGTGNKRGNGAGQKDRN